MYSFCVFSVFTNVSLEETVKIYLEAFKDISDTLLFISKDVFAGLITSALFVVEFYFNGLLCKTNRRYINVN